MITATPNHPFALTTGGWREASELMPGDQIATLDGREVRLLTAQILPGSATTYNLKVALDSTYFVGNAGLWVHNQGACCPKIRGPDGRFLTDPDSLKTELGRPSLRAETKQAIEQAAIRDADGNFLDENGVVIKTPTYGHIYGRENRRILAAADAYKLDQAKLNDYVNNRPEFFKMEEKSRNLGHFDEKPGYEGFEEILDDITNFFQGEK